MLILVLVMGSGAIQMGSAVSHFLLKTMPVVLKKSDI